MNRILCLLVGLALLCFQPNHASAEDIIQLFRSGDYDKCMGSPIKDRTNNDTFVNAEGLEFVKIFSLAECSYETGDYVGIMMKIRNYELKHPDSHLTTIMKYQRGKILLAYSIIEDKRRIDLIRKTQWASLKSEEEKRRVIIEARINQLSGVLSRSVMQESFLHLQRYIDHWNIDYLSGELDEYFCLDQLKMMEIEALHLTGRPQAAIECIDKLLSEADITPEIIAQAHFYRGLSSLSITNSDLKGVKSFFHSSLELLGDSKGIVSDEIRLWDEMVARRMKGKGKDETVFVDIFNMKPKEKEKRAWRLAISRCVAYIDCNCN